MNTAVIVRLNGHLGMIKNEEINNIEANLKSKLKDIETIILINQPNERWGIEVDFKEPLADKKKKKVGDVIREEVGSLFQKKFEAVPQIRWILSGKAGDANCAADIACFGAVGSETKESANQIAPVVAHDEPNEEIKILAKQIKPVEVWSGFSFENIVLHKRTRIEIEMALKVATNLSAKYKEWRLNQLDSSSHCIFNFRGEPGTGKTLTARAIAARLNKRLIIADCPMLMDSLMGNGSKRIEAAFLAARDNNAILFFDEADAFVSTRIATITSGADLESNAWRNTLLTCLEKYDVFVILASNMAKKCYDKAFISRMRSFEFPMPSHEMLEELWKVHMNSINASWSDDVDPNNIEKNGEKIRELAKKAQEYKFSGRDVKFALLWACECALLSETDVGFEDLMAACNKRHEDKLEV